MTYEQLWRPLAQIYDEGEAKAMARMVLSERFGLSMADILCGRMEQLSANQQQELALIQQRLLTYEPVQYVLGEADFGGRTFQVTPAVLIPRPETYELCQWIIASDQQGQMQEILDIGTGSGCIACTLAAELPGAQVTGWDISEGALQVAEGNAHRLDIPVTFTKTDALTPPRDRERWDLIVSNPPYICEREKAQMERNVLAYEPKTALFVDDHTPLLFYVATARYARQALKPGGMLFFEINPLYADGMLQMLNEEGFTHTEIRNDQFGKQRFTKSWL